MRTSALRKLGLAMALLALATLGPRRTMQLAIVGSHVAPARAPYELGLSPLGEQPSNSVVSASDLEAHPAASRVPRQLVLRFRPESPQEVRSRVRDELGVRLLEPLGIEGMELVAVEKGSDVNDVRREAASNDAIAYAEPNFVYHALATPDDPYWDELWGLENVGAAVGGRPATSDADIDASSAWDRARETSATTIAIVDSGVAIDHPDLIANIWRNPGEIAGNGIDDDGNGYVDDVSGWDWNENDSSPKDPHGHGTHVAGTVGATADNGLGIAGVDPNARLMALRVLGAEGSGSSADIASAFAYAAKNGAKVVNASLGGPNVSRAMEDAIRQAPDTLFVVAAGNDGTNNDSVAQYPCNYTLPNVICVTATDPTDQLADFSNHGAQSVDIAAPGVSILSAVPTFVEAFTDDFSSPISGTWLPGAGWGLATEDDDPYLSDSPSGHYADGSDSTITLATAMDLGDLSECRLGYHLRLDAQAPNDGLRIEESRDGISWGGVSNWSGSTKGKWVRVSHDLDVAGSGHASVRFRFVSDGSGTAAGADIDNVRVACLPKTYSRARLAYYSGTSMASPHVAGAAAFLWSVEPEATAGEIKGALLAGGDLKSSLVGQVASSARLNLAGAVEELIGASSGETPAPATRPVPAASTGPADETGTPTAMPEPEPSEPGPDPTPTRSPDPARREGEVRTVKFELRRHLVAVGRVFGAAGCTEDAPVKILRGGRVIERATTGDGGGFRVRLGDRPGFYQVKVPEIGSSPVCEAVASTRRRHAH